MNRRRCKARVTPWGALVCLVAVLSTGAAQSFAAASRADAVLSVQGRITLLAADGNHAAVTTTVKRACARRIVVWSAPGRSSVSVKPGILGCAGDGVTRLAVGGGRVAWIEQGGGNSLEMAVMAAGLTGGARKQFEFATNGDRASGDPSGQWVGQLLGGGSLLAYNRWTQVCDRPEVEACGHKDPQLRLTDQQLIRIAAGRRAVVLRGSAAYPLIAVGGGHLAVQRRTESRFATRVAQRPRPFQMRAAKAQRSARRGLPSRRRPRSTSTTRRRAHAESRSRSDRRQR